MKILIDTIDLNLIKKYYNMGILAGVTTNPTLAKKFGMSDDVDMVKKIREVMTSGEIHVEAFGNNELEIIENAVRIKEKTNDGDLVFKVPFNEAGVSAASKIKKLGYKTNLHLIFSLNQALISSTVQSDYICPLMGRLDDVGHDAFANLEKIKHAFERNNTTTKIMASSIRHPLHVQHAFERGADVVTIPVSVLEKMFKHPLTKIGFDLFSDDIKMMQKINLDTVSQIHLVEHDITIKETLKHMTDNKINTVVVNTPDNRVGIFTMGDFKRLLNDNNFLTESFITHDLHDYLSFDAKSIDINSTNETLNKMFNSFDIGSIVVTSKDKAVGCIIKSKASFHDRD